MLTHVTEMLLVFQASVIRREPNVEIHLIAAVYGRNFSIQLNCSTTTITIIAKSDSFVAIKEKNYPPLSLITALLCACKIKSRRLINYELIDEL